MFNRTSRNHGRGASLRQPRYACWFAKPDGMKYDELFTRLEPVVDGAEGALWMRQMVLGPAREFCLHAPAPVSMADEFSPVVLPLRPIWPASASESVQSRP